MRSYRSDYPNHLHQLNVCISKHYYATRDGLLKYQKKAMDVSLAKSSLADRRHMLVYCIRDHCSGVFYAEIDFFPAVAIVPSFGSS